MNELFGKDFPYIDYVIDNHIKECDGWNISSDMVTMNIDSSFKTVYCTKKVNYY